MKTCPFCQTPVEEDSSYCPNCNKPLIVKVNKNEKENQEFDSYHLETNLAEPFNTDIIQDDSIDNEIRRLDEELKTREKFGEPIGELLLKKANLYYQKRDLDNSIRTLETALHYFQNMDDRPNIAVCHNELGLMREELGFFDEAIYHFDMAIDFFEELGDFEKTIKVYNNIAFAYYLINDLEKSYEYYTNALRLSEEKSAEYQIVKTSSNLVDVLFLLKDYERIMKILSKNYEFFKQQRDIYGLIITLTKFGKFYYHKGSDYYENSYENINEALEYLKGVKDQISKIKRAKLDWESYFLLGKLNIAWQSYSEAENYLLKALESIRTFELGGWHIFEGKVLNALGEFYYDTNDYQKAIEYFKLAIETFNHYGIQLKEAKLKRRIGEIFLEDMGDSYEALGYLENALKLFKSLNYSKETAELYMKLGDIYNNRGIEQLTISNFEKARKLYKALQDEYHSNLLREKIKSIKDHTGF
jgi:tetratricopeptide (TPR) repeat protein